MTENKSGRNRLTDMEPEEAAKLLSEGKITLLTNTTSMTTDWREEFDRVFVTENLWKSDDELTANVPIENIKKFIAKTLHDATEKARGEGREEAVDYIEKEYMRESGEKDQAKDYVRLDAVLEAARHKV